MRTRRQEATRATHLTFTKSGQAQAACVSLVPACVWYVSLCHTTARAVRICAKKFREISPGRERNMQEISETNIPYFGRKCGPAPRHTWNDRADELAARLGISGLDYSALIEAGEALGEDLSGDDRHVLERVTEFVQSLASPN